jgi:predicted adenylyl cyclase CyaB
MENLEIKCHYPEHRRALTVARAQWPRTRVEQLRQTDTYFNVSRGRLKLRCIQEAGLPAEGHYELIFYHRPNRRSARTSHYEILAIAQGPCALSFLTTALGVRVVVRKKRSVIRTGNVRLHLDTVDGLGKFLEIELLVSPSFPLAAYKEQMRQLRGLFDIADESLISVSYADLLLQAGRRGHSP